MVRVNVEVKVDIYKDLKILALERDMTVPEVVNFLLRKGLEALHERADPARP